MRNIGGNPVPLAWGEGWFPLTSDVIDSCVDPLPGSYILGKAPCGIIIETRTGSSHNLKERLKQHARDGEYDVFRFQYDEDADSEALFQQESEIYIDTHGVPGLGHGEKEPPKRHRV